MLISRTLVKLVIHAFNIGVLRLQNLQEIKLNKKLNKAEY